MQMSLFIKSHLFPCPAIVLCWKNHEGAGNILLKLNASNIRNAILGEGEIGNLRPREDYVMSVIYYSHSRHSSHSVIRNVYMMYLQR